MSKLLSDDIKCSVKITTKKVLSACFRPVKYNENLRRNNKLITFVRCYPGSLSVDNIWI